MSATSRSGKRDAVKQSIDEQEVRDALLREPLDDTAGQLADD
ncbi:hypothetical protein [Curtobacterium sp. RRHDQ10]